MKILIIVTGLFLLSASLQASDLVCKIKNATFDSELVKKVIPLISHSDQAHLETFADLAVSGATTDEAGKKTDLYFVPVLTSQPGGIISSSIIILNAKTYDEVQHLQNLDSYTVTPNKTESFEMKNLTLNLGMTEIKFTINCQSVGVVNLESTNADDSARKTTSAKSSTAGGNETGKPKAQATRKK